LKFIPIIIKRVRLAYYTTCTFYFFLTSDFSDNDFFFFCACALAFKYVLGLITAKRKVLEFIAKEIRNKMNEGKENLTFLAIYN
jgi:hypothetical protein